MREKSFVSFVVYVYNAEKVIQEFIKSLDQAAAQKFETYEIILVNDQSDDSTKAQIKAAGAGIKGNLTVLNLAWRHRRELAMLAGTDLAIGDFVFELETTRPDFTWDIIVQLYDKCVSGFDVVFAFPKNKTKTRSRLFYWLLNKLSYLNVETSTETAKIVSRKALNRALLERGKIRYRKVLYKYCGFPTAAVVYEPISGTTDKNEMTLLQKTTLATDVFVVFSNIGIHIAMLFSVLSMIISATIGIYALIAYISGLPIISGWTTTMLFLSMGFSGIFLTLTILAKYISTILQEQRQGSLYTVETIDRIINR